MAAKRDRNVLGASLAAVRLMIDSNGNASVVELAKAANLSRRTWHRYFPAKEDLLRPMLQDGADIVLRTVAERSASTGIVEAWLRGFEAAAAGLFTERTRGLMPLVLRDPSLSAVFDHEVSRSASRLRDLIAGELEPRERESDRIAALATTLVALSVSALRDAVGTPIAPHVILGRRIDALHLSEIVPPTVAEERRIP